MQSTRSAARRREAIGDGQSSTPDGILPLTYKLGGPKIFIPSDTTLKIEASYTIHGRGLVLIPEEFLFVSPKGVPEPFADSIRVIGPDGTYEEVEAHFLIEHFSLATENGALYGRYSLVLLLPEKLDVKVPVGSQICVSESTLSRMKNMVKWS